MVSTRGTRSPASKADAGGSSRRTSTRKPVSATAAAQQEAEATAARRSRRSVASKRAVVEESEEEEDEEEEEQQAPVPTKRNGRRASQPAATTTTTKAKGKAASGGAAGKGFDYEFGGPWGALGIILGLPVVVLGLYFYCPNQGAPGVDGAACLRWADIYRFLSVTVPSTLQAWAAAAKHLDPKEAGAALAAWGKALPAAAGAQAEALWGFVRGELWDAQAFACVCGWFLFQVLLERVLPGEVALGVPIARAGGQRLPYRLNGHLAFWVSLLVMGHAYPRFASPAAASSSSAAAAAAAAAAELASEAVEGLGEEALAAAAEAAREAAAAAAAAGAGGSAGGSIPVLGELVGLGAFPLAQLYDRYPQFAFAAILFSFLLALGLYLASFRRGAVLAEGGESGNAVYDFYMGRELNPRTGSFDWKCFCELRPGLIGWVVLNLGMLCAQHERHPGQLHGPLVLVNLFQAWYVLDALVNERAILTTMDITTDGFGFMLAFGDLAWVPFTYSLQARYLVGRDPGWGSYGLAALSGLHLLGYWIFRQANSTKDAFRRDPASVPHVKFLETKRGTKLMTSGWWGWARKINYTGDWLMALAWCLLCGPTHAVPYFYCIYFGVLLAHRAARDDHFCALKYGADWDKYKKAVPSLFLPGIY